MDEDKHGSQDEGHKHLDVDVVPGTVQLSEGHSHVVCVPYVCFTGILTDEGKEDEKKYSHLNRQKMAMAMLRVMRDSSYPTVYVVFTKVKYQWESAD